MSVTSLLQKFGVEEAYHPAENSAGVVVGCVGFMKESVVKLLFGRDCRKISSFNFHVPVLKIKNVCSTLFGYYNEMKVVGIVVLGKSFFVNATKVDGLIQTVFNLIHFKDWLREQILIPGTREFLAESTEYTRGAMMKNVVVSNILCPKMFELGFVDVVLNSNHESGIY